MGIIMATGAPVPVLFHLDAAEIVRRRQLPLVFSARLHGIGFSLFVVGLAAFNLLLDFDFIEKAAASRSAEVHGMVRRVRPDGHADLAVPGDPPPADEAGRSAMRRKPAGFSDRRTIRLDQPSRWRGHPGLPLAPCDASMLGYSVVT